MDKIINDYKLFWQYPVITEKVFYEQNKNNSSFIGFPWATIIDKRYGLNTIFKIIKKYISEEKYYYTCCQHISFRKLIPLFKALNICVIFTPHKIKVEDNIDDILILPIPLYAVNFEDETRNIEFKNVDFLNKKRFYLYSFIGGFQPDYLTNVRKNIFNMKHPDKTLIINTGGWHFNNIVYSSKQNFNKELNIDKNHLNNMKNYNEVLLNSRYSLCPSGTGPNSIRFWESLACGSIPILLSDSLDLPSHSNWSESIIIIPEINIDLIPNIIKNITPEKEKKMRSNCLEIYKFFNLKYSGNYLTEIPRVLFTSYSCDKNDNILNNILLKWKKMNPTFEVKYFSDLDVLDFFKNHTNYYDIVSKMKNGVALADFFRICYIQKFGGYWFDLDLEPIKINTPLIGNIHLFDCGYGNISYMFLGGKQNQILFNEVIKNVFENIKVQLNKKTKHILDITGPRIIQNIIFNYLNIENKDNNFIGNLLPKIYLKNTEFEFVYQKSEIKNHKSNLYKNLQEKYNKKAYQYYNYI